MRILTRKEFQDDMAKMWSEAVEAEYKAQIEAAVLAEREALIRYFDGHWRSDWSDGQIIEALEARGNC